MEIGDRRQDGARCQARAVMGGLEEGGMGAVQETQIWMGRGRRRRGSTSALSSVLGPIANALRPSFHLPRLPRIIIPLVRQDHSDGACVGMTDSDSARPIFLFPSAFPTMDDMGSLSSARGVGLVRARVWPGAGGESSRWYGFDMGMDDARRRLGGERAPDGYELEM
jgi:hypothetical protein